MGNWKRLLTKSKTLGEQANDKTNATLSEVLSTYDLVEVVENNGDPFVIVSEKGRDTDVMEYPQSTAVRNVILSDDDPLLKERDAYGQPKWDRFGRSLTEPGKWMIGDGGGRKLVDYSDVSIGELGSSSVSPFTSWIRREYNRDLVGIKGLQVYDKMRKSDGTVRGTLRSVKTPVLAARWFIEPEDQEKTADKNAADYIWKNLTHMSISWPQVLIESLLMLEFGYYMFEIVWEEKIVDGKLRLWVQKLAPRHPMDVWTWHFDPNGGPAGVTMFSPTGNSQDQVTIPINKLLVFTFDREAGDIEGISLLRSAYKHWYYIDQFYKIDSIQKERHGIGIPVIKLPPGFSITDKNVAENLGRNLRTNERAHVVLPPNWDIIFAQLSGNPVDCLKSIKEHKESIRESTLLGFMSVDTQTKEEDQSMFLKATRFIADIVEATFNSYLIPKMMDANFQRVGYPTLKARRIGEQADWRTLSFAVRNLIGAGALRPDDKLEEMLREEMDLPKVDKATIRPTGNVRETVQAIPGPGGTVEANPADTTPKPAPGSTPTTQQRGAKVGLPRQGPPPSGKIGPNAGIDKSGGK